MQIILCCLDQDLDQHILLRNLHLSYSDVKCMNIERLITSVLGVVKGMSQVIPVEQSNYNVFLIVLNN